MSDVDLRADENCPPPTAVSPLSEAPILRANLVCVTRAAALWRCDLPFLRESARCTLARYHAVPPPRPLTEYEQPSEHPPTR
jgi:hypothetical protein